MLVKNGAMKLVRTKKARGMIASSISIRDKSIAADIEKNPVTWAIVTGLLTGSSVIVFIIKKVQ
jgi:hypothetical protein